ncbi:MAG: right-handed parallel beta-helix repeat-containing protein [Candidatus Thermoplasmatota archaeon]
MKIQILFVSVFVFILFLDGCVENNDLSDNDSSSVSELFSYRDLLPAEIAGLSEGFYPAGWTRASILDKLHEAMDKTGNMEFDSWSGVVRVTGDMHIGRLTIQPGTIVFIDAHSDDQNNGWVSTVDPMNPHEFLGENYSFHHIFIQVRDELIARGTEDEPIIITSTSDDPWLADWEKIVFKKGVLEYAVVEYGIGMAIESSDVTISHCLIRDMLSQGVMFGSWPEAGIKGESVSPNITYNYMYNFGHMAVQSFYSEPLISNNIFIQRNTNDSELYEYLSKGENGALDLHGGNGTVEHNFLSSGYDSTIEKERPKHGCSGIGITTATKPKISFNTIVGNNVGIELQGGNPIINYNNIHDNVDNNLVVRGLYSEPGREDTVIVYDEPIDARENWWGSSEQVLLTMNVENGVEVNYEPIALQEISGAGPDWSGFRWLYN